MKKIIVTVTDECNSFFFDMELPVEYPVSMMIPTITELLNQNQSRTVFKAERLFLGANRQKKIIPAASTLEDAGIWNGDYITILQR